MNTLDTLIALGGLSFLFVTLVQKYPRGLVRRFGSGPEETGLARIVSSAC